MLRFSYALTVALLVSTVAGPARAANILFVSDSMTDITIGPALMADGHTVTSVTMDFSTGNATLRGDLSEYDAVFWSSTGGGGGDVVPSAEVITNLERYVMAGGRVFVTGYDSVASPTDPLLIAFCGATSANDVPGPQGPIAMMANSLTTGLVDIQGMTPSDASGDTDELTGLTTGTVEVVRSTRGGGSQWTLRTLGAGEIAYVSQGDGGASFSRAGSVFNSAIRNFAFAAEGGARPDGAPVIEFEGPHSIDEGAAATITVAVTDEEGDPVTFSWDLNDDGTFGDMPGSTSYAIAAGTTDGTTAMRIGVQATDGTNMHTRYRTIGIQNVAPTVTSEPPGSTSVGARFMYPIIAVDPAGDMDPLTYEIALAPDRVTVTESGIVLWMPRDLDASAPGESHRIEIRINDGDEGETLHGFDLIVSPNRVPTGGTAIWPPEGAGILDRQTRLVMGNATDQDRDPLGYFFQIDRVDTFDSPELQESPRIDETPGYSFWHVASPLTVGRWHWRAWANDGTADGEPVMASFFEVPDPGMLPDAGPGDSDGGGGGADAGTRPPKKDSGGCSVGGAAGGTGWVWLLVASAVLVLVSRSRRRRVVASCAALGATLASAAVARAGAPSVTIDAPMRVDEGAEITLMATVSDVEGDPVTFSWDLDDDGVFGEMPDATTATIAAGVTDGPAPMRVGVQASDGTTIQERYVTINVTNLPPVVTSEAPSVTSQGSPFMYPIVATDPGEDLDPLEYAIVLAPERLSVSTTGVVTWTPHETDVTAPGEAHHIEINISDGDEGEVTHAFDLIVSPNRIPMGGSILFPPEGAGVTETMPRLVVGNATDRDRDPLGYFFLVDRVDTFDSPDLIESPRIDETPGYSFWYVTSELGLGRWHWRAVANDGMADGDPLTASFFVVPDGMGTVDGGPGSDAGTPSGTDAGIPRPPPKKDEGCSASGGSSRGGAPYLGALAALVIGITARTMRRRSSRRPG